MKNSIIIRKYKKSDLTQMVKLFIDTVHTINKKDYTQEQLNAWAPENLDVSRWEKALAKNICYVAEYEGQIVGFADMSLSGYLDRVYVHKDFQGKFIAKRLGTKLLHDAKKLKIPEITSDVSITALPLAKRLGFRVISDQRVERRGVSLTNYKVKMDVIK